jgi:hypothetical protein
MVIYQKIKLKPLFNKKNLLIAEKCIKFLRENKIGQAAFLPIEKFNNFIQRMRTPFRAPEGS